MPCRKAGIRVLKNRNVPLVGWELPGKQIALSGHSYRRGLSAECCSPYAVGLPREITLKILQNRSRHIKWFRVATAALAIVFGLNLCRVAAKVGVNLDEL
jgi:hypothetical protein